MGDPMQFRWLGAAGSEWSVDGRILAIDPFFTRPPFHKLWFGRVSPNGRLVSELMRRCDVILVTHSHCDHLMDVPEVVRLTGAQVLGSPNTCALLAACGVPERQIQCVEIGDHRTVQGFEIEVLPATHPHIPIDHLVNGPLSPRLNPPLRLIDYRADVCFSFMVRVAGWRILSGDQPISADVWLASPFSVRTDDEPLLRAIHPQLVIPIHWDNLFRPLDRGIRPMLAPPSRSWPPLHRLDMAAFRREIRQRAPGAKVVIPEALRAYSLDDLLGSIAQPVKEGALDAH
jgi:L-ascorbate metabolism protein UlaG (beta-lactamase superfamily)